MVPVTKHLGSGSWTTILDLLITSIFHVSVLIFADKNLLINLIKTCFSFKCKSIFHVSGLIFADKNLLINLIKVCFSFKCKPSFQEYHINGIPVAWQHDFKNITLMSSQLPGNTSS